jgi:hypothetical protein
MKQEQKIDTSAPATPAITREAIRLDIAKHATAIGCDRKKAVSGAELLVIFLRTLEGRGVLPSDYCRKTALQIVAHFDANSSAMTKRLYESEGKVDRADALAAMLSAPPTE